MKFIFYTDPHIGLSRKAHSTPAASVAREKEALRVLHELLDAYPGHIKICLGDLFDRTENDEQTILNGLAVAQRTDRILSGNHDRPNREGKQSSLGLLREVLGDKVVMANFSANRGTVAPIYDTSFYFAPHVLTQTDYMAMIANLAEQAKVVDSYRILCLHCNWDMPEHLLSDSTLNLSEGYARELLEVFHWILIGHTHTPADYLDGRVKIIGSTFPTAFDNLDSKRALIFDSDTGGFSDVPLWDADTGYFYGPASDLTEGGPRPQFYDIVDDLDPGEVQKLAVTLFKEGAFGVRLNKKEGAEQEKLEISVAQFHRLTETIEQRLTEEHPDLLPIWRELVGS